MKTNPLLIDLFSFIDQAKIRGTLSFPLRGSIYDPKEPLAYRRWYTVELTEKLIDDLTEDKFQLVAIEKAEQTMASINLDIFNSAKNTASVLDRYLSTVREIDTRLEYLKSLTEQGIIFNNLEDVQCTPPGNVENLEYAEYKALNEFLTTKILMRLRREIKEYIAILRSTTKISEFIKLLPEKANIETSVVLTHRMHALIYKYKAEAGIILKVFSPTEVEKEFGPKRKQAFYTVWNEKKKPYKAPTEKELETIIPFLAEFPNAQKAVINDLDKLKNNL